MNMDSQSDRRRFRVPFRYTQADATFGPSFIYMYAENLDIEMAALEI